MGRFFSSKIPKMSAVAIAKKNLTKKGFLDIDIDPSLDLFEEIEKLKKEKYANKIKEHAKKFNWQTASTSYLELYERLLSEKQIH